MKAIISLFAALMLLAGCASPDRGKELREYDLRSAGNYEYFQTDIYMDLPTVQRQLFINREHCNVTVQLKKDPMQVHYATVHYAKADASDLKDKVLLDLTAYATGKLSIEAYGYYARNLSLAKEVVRVLGDPTFCPEGIEPKIK